GFNGGIGFHALEGKSYYKYLGKKNVSHGCVRMSREDAEMLYSLLEKGTPILVHKGNAAIKIAFTEENINYDHLSYKELRRSLPERYSVLYNGEYFLKQNQKLLLDEKNVPASGLPVGDANLIPPKQSVISPYLWISPETPEFVKINSLLDGNIPGFLTLNLTLDTKTSHQKI
ncbi:MAG TPA: L,D-transpeptidase, partial [Ignavibacteriaceae bacterium]|nr:L,D-transpeptidase [Ignavibacteriaceae bacterium]